MLPPNEGDSLRARRIITYGLIVFAKSSYWPLYYHPKSVSHLPIFLTERCAICSAHDRRISRSLQEIGFDETHYMPPFDTFTRLQYNAIFFSYYTNSRQQLVFTFEAYDIKVYEF